MKPAEFQKGQTKKKRKNEHTRMPTMSLEVRDLSSRYFLDREARDEINKIIEIEDQKR